MFDYKFNEDNIFKEIDEYLSEIIEDKKPMVLNIGYIVFDDILSENEVGSTNFKSIGECKVDVYGGEGPIPHMHISNSEKSFSTCVCIFENKYFTHGKYKDKFNSKQCKQFNDWILSPYKKYNKGEKSNWEHASQLWEYLNGISDQYKNITTPPDYTNII